MRPSYRPYIQLQPQPYRTQILDHLGLVAGIFDELGIGTVRACLDTLYSSGVTGLLRPAAARPWPVLLIRRGRGSCRKLPFDGLLTGRTDTMAC
jgi:hypothetical protein